MAPHIAVLSLQALLSAARQAASAMLLLEHVDVRPVPRVCFTLKTRSALDGLTRRCAAPSPS